MIKGIGTDIIEIDRIKESIKRNSRMVQRILTKTENRRYSELSGKRQMEFIAGRFAAKEAFAKALGTGLGKEISFQDIEVLSNQVGAPYIRVAGYPSLNIWVSISHSAHYAIAQVVLEES